MMNLSYDLHIHSCLSPCGDNDMTPANIAGMAAIKGLDVIALTDHNSCKNCEPLLKMAECYRVTAIPGMEICTSEEVHVVCLFPSLEAAMDFDSYVYKHILPIKNDEKIFGEQLLYNENDEITGKEPLLLISSTDISIDKLWTPVSERGGVMIPAHIDKNANSLLANLGFIPPDSCFTCAEVKNMEQLHRLKAENPYLNKCRIITDSDAHYLQDIHEPEWTIQSESRDIKDILKALQTVPHL